MRTPLILNAMALSVFVTACSDGSSRTDGPATHLDQTTPDQRRDLTSATADRSTVDRVAVEYRVSGVLNSWKGAALGGAQVCAYRAGGKSTTCVETKPGGQFEITLPGSTPTGLFFDAVGYERAFVAFLLTKDWAFPNTGIYDDATAKAEYGKMGSAYPPQGKGHIVVIAPTGAQFAVTPNTGLGPYYAGTAGTLDPSLTSISSGWGMVLDLPPGEYELDCKKGATPCTMVQGWPSTAHGARLPVFDGYFSEAYFTCP